MSASVLIGVVTRNRAGILPKAVSSAVAQSCQQLEVAVLDDGSVDNTPAVALEFPKVSWARWEQSAGLIVARNHLMRESSADYYVSLDDDAWFLQGDEISIAVNYLERHPAVAAVAFDILSPDRPNSVPREAPQTTAMFIGCGHVLRMSAVRSVGMYETSPGIYGGEEKDICLRLMDAGYQIVRLPGVHVWHDKTLVAREIPSQHTSGVCNDLVMTLRRTPAFLLPVAIAAKLYRHLQFSVRHGLTRPCLQGFQLFVRSIPAVLRTRRPVRAATLRTYMRLARA